VQIFGGEPSVDDVGLDERQAPGARVVPSVAASMTMAFFVAGIVGTTRPLPAAGESGWARN
jgi:hypothetical protein